MKVTIKMIIMVIFGFFAFNNCLESILWNKYSLNSFEWSQDFIRQMTENIQFNSNSKNISIDCSKSIRQTLDALKNGKVWAIELINSWGRFPPKGFLVGTGSDYGSYQCLSVQPNSNIDRPQYCLIDLVPPIPEPMPVHHNLHHRIDVLPKHLANNMQNVFTTYSEFASFFYWVSLRTGICTPSKCTPNDISLMAEVFADNYGLKLKQSRCESKPTKTTLTAIQMIALSFVASVLLISLMATFWDNSRESHMLIHLFSMKRNLKCLLAKRSSEMFPCIHGIRVLSMVWIIFCHSTEWNNFQIFTGTFRVKDMFSRVEVQLVMNGEYAVDTFFLIGGILTSYMTLQYTHALLSRFNLIEYLLSRFLRLTPQLLIFVLMTFLLPLSGSGPIWNETFDPIIEMCSKNWWWNLFYIQNWLKESDICGIHTWYLACDMQYHWISLILIIPLLYKVKLGIVLTGLSIMIFYLTSIIISYSYDLPPGMINTGRDEHLMEYYVGLFFRKPWAHSTVFFIGFLLGIFLYKRKIIKLNSKTKLSIFAMIITGYMVCLMDTYHWNTGKPYKRLLSALVFSTCRLIWSLSTAALIWMCTSGNGGMVSALLTAHTFTPFSRLTYSVYLTHAWKIWIFGASRRHLIETNLMDLFYIFLHNLIISYLMGFLFALLFEAPVFKLQKHLINKFKNNRKNNKEDPALNANVSITLLGNNK